MSKKNKLQLDFSEFDTLLEKFENTEKDVRKAVEKGMVNSGELVTEKIQDAMKKHYRTGKTISALYKDRTVTWEGSIATMPVGFNLKTGGLPSIFLMYGTPKMNPDKKLYNALYGNSTKKRIKQIYEDTFARELNS